MREKFRIVFACSFVIVLFLTIYPQSVDCAEQPRDPEKFKVGFISCITGPVSWIHGLWSKTANLAIDEINAEGGIAGRPMEIIYEDNKVQKLKDGLILDQIFQLITNLN